MIADFHNDLLTTPQAGKEDIDKFSQSVKSGVCALFRGMREFSDLRRLADTFRCCKTNNLYLGLENVGYANEENIEEICSWNPVYASLTWNEENELAGGCMSSGRLTPRGKKIVRTLSSHGISIDCAHINAESFCDILDCVPASIIDSHTCINGVNKHPRNLSDWQMKEIIARDGLIGITFVGKFLAARGATVQDVFKHIDYGVQKFGVDYFCIGTDFNGTDDLPVGLYDYVGTERLADIFVKSGYSDSAINKIFVQNLEKFLKN